jgi:K+-transporting ATPase ATPase C chain
VDATTLENAKQTAVGPVASHVAIKIPGTNGGGFFNAAASHPLENPTVLSNYVQMISIMGVLFITGVAVCYRAEARGNDAFTAMGLSGRKAEGKEERFGIHHRPVRRHQGHRCAHHRFAPRLRRTALSPETRPAIVCIAALTLITGLLYPLAMTGRAQVLFPRQANGSLIGQDSKVLGSELLGQVFTSDAYLHGRPSATNTPDPKDPTKTVDAPYNAANSGSSNLGQVKGDVDKLKTENPSAQPPVDPVTTSGGSLEPHITPEAASSKVPRVAKVRSLPQDRVRQLVDEHGEGRKRGVLGESRVNVCALNLALDRQAAK